MHIAQCLFGVLLTAVVLTPGDQQPITIHADVNLVQLQLRVTDANGRSVPGLQKDVFQLWVDDAPQPITAFGGEDAPVTAGIIIDNSASMAPKREEVAAAALAFARASNPKDQMFVVHFNDHARLALPPETPFTGVVSELESAIAAFQLGGTTALYDAIVLGVSQFRKAAYARRVLLTVTDGGDNSSHATQSEALDSALKAGVVIYSIGIFDEKDRDRNPPALSQMASQTGGEAYFPEATSEVKRICVDIAEDVRRQYTIGFPGADDGLYHRIRVTASNPGLGPLTVRTRGGYIATKGPSAAQK